MSTGRLEKRLETIVWSVLMLNDFTVVSGDSRGKTSFWNSRNGTLLDSYQSHKGDILTVTCNQDQTVIYASGADPTIVHFQSVVTGENKVSFDSDCFLGRAGGTGVKLDKKLIDFCMYVFKENITFYLGRSLMIKKRPNIHSLIYT